MAEITIPDIIEIGNVSTYLAANYEGEGGLFGERLAVTSPQSIQLVTDALRWQWEDFPIIEARAATGSITIDTINTGIGNVKITVFVNDPKLGTINLGSTYAYSGMTTTQIATAVYNAIKNNPYQYYIPAPDSNIISITAPIGNGADINGNNNLFCSLYNIVNNNFNVGSGFDGTVLGIAIQGDGKILCGGYFNIYKATLVNNIIRLNSDGSIDNTFIIGNGFSQLNYVSHVNNIAIQSDNKILIGGLFDSYKNVASNNIIRLNTDGSKDTSFSIGTGFDGEVFSIAIQSDGKIICVGDFAFFNGVQAIRIARLNSNGSRDTSFVYGIVGFNAIVTTVKIQSDGKILCGGYFTTFNNVSSNCIIRLNSNGSRDTSFSIGDGFFGVVYSIAIQADGKILCGGNFNSYNNVSVKNIIRLNPDGSIDNTFITGSGFNTDVNSIAVQADGKILVCGLFNTYNGVAASEIIRLNPDGSIDTSFEIGNGFSDGGAYIIKLTTNKIYVGGDFTKFQGWSSPCIISLNQ